MRKEDGDLILLVDDEPAYQDITRALLTPFAIETAYASDPLEAFRMMRSVEPSLILMDIQMAGIDGYRGLKRIRQSAERKVPVIAFTAQHPPGGERFFLEHDFDGWLPKPFDAGQFTEVVGRWITLDAGQIRDPQASLLAIVGERRAADMMTRLATNLAEAIRLIDAGADPGPSAHRLGGLLGTMGFGPLAQSWLALSNGRRSAWQTVKAMSREWLDHYGEVPEPRAPSAHVLPSGHVNL